MQSAGVSASAPNMEGKELRYGTDQSSLWAVATTDASNGSVNSMHDSYKPFAMITPMFNLGVGEVIWGGVGQRPVRDDLLRHHRRVHRRADGRANA